jgi:hypothetical protein
MSSRPSTPTRAPIADMLIDLMDEEKAIRFNLALFGVPTCKFKG